MRYSLHHQTRYVYCERVSFSQHIAHFRPLNTANQQVNSYRLEISPTPDSIFQSTDYFGNCAEYFSLLAPHKELEVNAYAELDVNAPLTPPLDFSPAWEEVVSQLAQPINAEDIKASEYIFPTDDCPVLAPLATYAKRAFTPGAPILQAALKFNEMIHQEFRFDPKATNVTTSVAEVFDKRAGVCQDFAHLQISALRSLGLAARYVSGYIRTDPPAGKPRLIGADASHAWISIYIPAFGWVDFDSTNNVIPTINHLTVAYGRDYNDISPIRGIVYGGGSQKLSVAVTVMPLE